MIARATTFFLQLIHCCGTLCLPWSCPWRFLTGGKKDTEPPRAHGFSGRAAASFYLSSQTQRTPLHYACGNARIECIRCLVKCPGIDISARDKVGPSQSQHCRIVQWNIVMRRCSFNTYSLPRPCSIGISLAMVPTMRKVLCYWADLQVSYSAVCTTPTPTLTNGPLSFW